MRKTAIVLTIGSIAAIAFFVLEVVTRIQDGDPNNNMDPLFALAVLVALGTATFGFLYLICSDSALQRRNRR